VKENIPPPCSAELFAVIWQLMSDGEDLSENNPAPDEALFFVMVQSASVGEQ